MEKVLALCQKAELECISVFRELIVEKRGSKLEIYDEWFRRFPCIKTCKKLTAHVSGMVADGQMLLEAVHRIDLLAGAGGLLE